MSSDYYGAQAGEIADSAERPCQCHDSFAAVSPTHPGHCCFVPDTQTCHAAEVAAWERRNALRHPAVTTREESR